MAGHMENTDNLRTTIKNLSDIRYYESLKNTPEPDDVRNPVAIDYKGLIAYAKERDLEPCNLSDEDKSGFIIT